MRIERLELEDVMLMQVAINSSFVMERYLTARRSAIIHKVAEANLILSRTFGILVWFEQVVDLCKLAGLSRKEAKLFRNYQYISVDRREHLKYDFIRGIIKLDYTRDDALRLFEVLAYTACDTWKRYGVAEQVKQFFKNTKQFI